MKIEDAMREVGKWLNEQPNREVDRHALSVCMSELHFLIYQAKVTPIIRKHIYNELAKEADLSVPKQFRYLSGHISAKRLRQLANQCS
jgi:hypothetical protein